MKAALLILALYVTGSIAVKTVTDLIVKDDRSKCDCCQPPCCCYCTRRVTEEVIQTLPPSTTPMPTTTTTGVVECNNTLDLCFIVDSSGSISSSDWIVAKQFIIDVVSLFKIGRADTRVALTQYSTNASVEWTFNGAQSKNIGTLSKAIEAVDQIGSFTNTVEAMEATVKEVFGTRGDRKDTPNACVVITDGRSNFRTKEVAEMSKRLQKESPVVAIGVTTEINMTELMIIATGENGENVYTVDSFYDLSKILTGLVKTVCEEIPTRPPPTEKQKRTTAAPVPGKIEEQCICCCPQMMFSYGAGGGCYGDCPSDYKQHQSYGGY